MGAEAERLRRELERNHALAADLDADRAPLPELESLQSWQRVRLARTHADLIAQDRYRDACHFFLEELYGGLEFRERDREVARVLPVMTRLLPPVALDALAGAFELQALSIELDLDMARHMQRDGLLEVDTERYGTLYRAVGRAADRGRQIRLIRDIGLELDRLVHRPLLLRLVRLLRGPAVAAGFGRLQAFLEEGLGAFRAIGGAEEFVNTIHARERAVMERLLAGDSDPFQESNRQPK